jgi:hypothetical protein
MPYCLAFEAQFRIENFEFAVTCKPHLKEISHEKNQTVSVLRVAFTEPVV